MLSTLMNIGYLKIKNNKYFDFYSLFIKKTHLFYIPLY
ncbi:hypothetical protein IMCC14465_09980 [alpha proteobacterium IMCC14465]|uniref:Uncharacterized protein n=1 Tax=alpha proteobacterium IMCC14465 TaxID=1220535 RepID=J9DW17_9PROT|nr:hypothetical protein IMCC14465_09980 [alpha proteobacterium IMCC14465]